MIKSLYFIFNVIVLPEIPSLFNLSDNFSEIILIFSIKKISLEMFVENVCSLPRDFAFRFGVTRLKLIPLAELK